MNDLQETLIGIAYRCIDNHDPSHDITHAIRVLSNALYITKHEGGDREVIIPAALFHDVIVHPKNHPSSKDSAQHSAEYVGPILQSISAYPPHKIPHVQQVIIEHSYSNGHKPSTLESRIVQDADRLELTGAIAIMRTFSSIGQMKTSFYNLQDPFCKTRKPDARKYGIDFCYTRLLNVHSTMNTKTAKEIAIQRAGFLRDFLRQAKEEIMPQYEKKEKGIIHHHVSS